MSALYTVNLSIASPRSGLSQVTNAHIYLLLRHVIVGDITSLPIYCRVWLIR